MHQVHMAHESAYTTWHMTALYTCALYKIYALGTRYRNTVLRAVSRVQSDQPSNNII